MNQIIAGLWLHARPALAVEEITSVSLFRHFVIDGGWITWFVLVPLSVVTTALALHYMITIRRRTQVPGALAEALVGAATRGQVRSILELTGEDETMLGQCAFAACARVGEGAEPARAAVEEAAHERATRLMRRIEYLNVIGNVSPMIGLFGTVVGMIRAFNRIFAAGGGMPDAAKLAGDISVALVTTFWGLLIAIPALTCFAVLRNRIDAFAAECVKFSDSLLSLLTRAPAARAE